MPGIAESILSSAGLRGEDKMEDRHLTERALGGRQGVSLMAVFDGHRGSAAAEFAVANVVPEAIRGWSKFDCAERTMQSIFLQLDGKFVSQQDVLWEERLKLLGAKAAGTRAFPGCTALILMQVWITPRHNTI